MFSRPCAWLPGGCAVTLTQGPHMLSTPRKQAFSMNAPASSTAAVAQDQRHGAVSASPAHADLANAIRALAMDAVEQAKSGHPGLPMGAADVATVLFTRFLKFDPADPAWPDRDRFVLSAGHGSMLIYALLYLTGYPAMTLDQIKRFRQLGSITAGHPEYGHTPGSRDHHRPARARPRQCGRHGDCGAALGGRIRRRRGRSQDLRARLRRRPDGRHQPGSHRARRSSQAQPADRAVRRQRHLHRRRAVAHRQRRSGQALRGRRLDRFARRRPRSRSDCRRARESAIVRPAGHDRLQDHHRLRRADQGRQGLLARFAARAPTRSKARARSSAGTTRRSKFPPIFCRLGARQASVRRARMPTGANASPRSMPANAPSSSAA